MAKREMVALKGHVYGGSRYKKGDRYFVEGESDRRVLMAVRHSEDAPPAEVETPKPQAAQAVRAAKTAAKKALGADDAPKRSGYFTRRLQADAVASSTEAVETSKPAETGEPVAGLTTLETPAADAPASDA